jgi:hypothetical protein
VRLWMTATIAAPSISHPSRNRSRRQRPDTRTRIHNKGRIRTRVIGGIISAIPAYRAGRTTTRRLIANAAAVRVIADVTDLLGRGNAFVAARRPAAPSVSLRWRCR